MENVQGVLTIDDGEPFKAWISFLSNLGYTSYTEILNARNYYIPQNRKRCFCVSILGEYAYSFLDKIHLKYRLKDFLEKDVDESYYLTEKQFNEIQCWNAYEKPLEKFEKTNKANISPTLTTRSGAYAAGMILVNGDKKAKNTSEIAVKESIPIKNNTKQGYLLAQDGDGLDLETRKGRSGTVQKGMIQTLNTQDNKGVVVKEIEQGKPACLNRKVDGKQPSLQDRVYSSSSSVAITQSFHPSYIENLRIRKLTEKECFRLMGIKNTDIDKFDTSKAQKYKLAGNSIVVQVMMGIFGKLYGMNDDEIEKKIKDSVEEVKQ